MLLKAPVSRCWVEVEVGTPERRTGSFVQLVEVRVTPGRC